MIHAEKAVTRPEGGQGLKRESVLPDEHKHGLSSLFRAVRGLSGPAESRRFGLAQRFGSATRGNEFPPKRGQSGGEVGDAGFIGNRNECAH